jgi:hypothetical protein
MGNQLALLPAGLTQADVERAQLPALYVAARNALEACARIDECKDLQDRYTAILRYAKQARNEELLKLCRKITLRAERKLGDLLRQIEKAGGGSKQKGVGRRALARSMGIDKDAMYRAMTIAKVPEQQFESVVESNDPPGRERYGALLRNPAAEISERAVALRALKNFARVCAALPASNLVGAFTDPKYNARARALLLVCGPWIHAVAQIVTHDAP